MDFSRYIGLEILRSTEDDLIEAERYHRQCAGEVREAELRLGEADKRLEWARSQFFAARDHINERIAAA